MTIKIDTKGRLVLPKQFRQRLGLFQGGRLDIAICAEGILLKSRRRVTAKDLYGIVPIKKVKLEEIENADGLNALG